VSTLDTHVDVGLTWRPISEADLPAWHELVAAIEAADDPAERNTLDDLRDYLLDGSWKDPAADSLIGLDDDGVPRAFGHVEVRPGDVRSVRAFCWGGVHPQWVTTEERLTGCTTLLEGAGFRPVRWYIDMSRPLDGVPVPEVPLDDGLRLVAFDPSLDERVRLAHNESFAEHWGSEPRTVEDWQRWTTGHRNFRADWSFVVLDGDEVAGYTLASAYEQDWAAQGYTSGWTDLLGVRPAWRGRRLAPALLTASMRAFAGSGMDRADIGVDSENASGALQLYTRLGYVEQRRGVMYAKDLG
jgi:ribosomal protein S18 acetylase RimI-like enzyme